MVGKLPSYVNDKDLEQRLGETGVAMMEIKYLKRDDHGSIIETPAERLYTISKLVAGIEKDYGKSQKEINDWTKQFYNVISNKDFLPGGRILTNTGSEIGALFNCYVLPIPDDLEGIYEQVKNAAVIHKKGGGTGYNFSGIRPRGTYVKTSHGVASGPVSFAGQFDKETEVINSGNRRGANIGILGTDHPDIIEWIHSKTTEGRLANFNLSVGATDEFMKAVKNGGHYALKFKGKPFLKKDLEKMIDNINQNMGGAEVLKKPDPPSLRIEDNKIYDTYWNEEIGRVYNDEVQLEADKVFGRIAKLAHATGDPGVIFLDGINRNNPLPDQGAIEATNPCGEQPLHPYDACNLGSINLSQMVKQSGGKTEVDYNKIKETVEIATRFLDNCNDLNVGPIPEIEKTVKKHRRIGLGVMGWADMLAKLEIPYDSKKALNLAEKVMETVTTASKEYSIELAKEKGEFPDFKESLYAKQKKPKIRNLLRTTIAPTGTIAMVAGCNSGMECFFAVRYSKNMRGGGQVAVLQPTFIEAMKKRGLEVDSDLEEKIKENNGSVRGLKEVPEDLQEVFKTSYEIPFEQHVRMQAAFQKHTDNAVSKTINLDSKTFEEDVKKAYLLSWELGCKGTTIYRKGSKSVEVLVSGKEAPNIHYVHTPMPNNNIVHNDTSTHYKIKRGKERMHVIFTSLLFKGKNNSYYFLPHADFQVTKPIGTEFAGEFAQSGIDRTQLLQGPDPDYIEIIRDLKSVRGDKSVGMGPNRIDSASHAVGICLEHVLLKQGIITYDENNNLVQEVRKKDLTSIPHNKAEEIIQSWRFSQKEETKTGEIHVSANRQLSVQFKCEKCDSTEYHHEGGCSAPICNGCGHQAGECD